MFIVCLYVCVFVGMYLSNSSPLERLEYLAAFLLALSWSLSQSTFDTKS